MLLHRDSEEVDTLKFDVLIRDNIIEKVDSNIPTLDSYEIIDCTDKIVSPGFVNTHHHVWQTQLKGLHADQTLLEYLPCGNMASSFYQPDDVFWGQLAGELEAINGGITTTLDFSHINLSSEHVAAALQATDVSGMRSVYAYCPTLRVSFTPAGTMEWLPLLEPWIMDTFDHLASSDLGPRINLGFAFDGLYLPKEVLQPLFKRVYAAPNLRVVTIHDNSTAMFRDKPSSYKTLIEQDLLDPRGKAHWVLVHPTTIVKEPISNVKKDNMFVSITPVSELSMGMGTPVPIALDRDYDAFSSQISVGIDCHSIGEAYIPGQLRSQLFAVRQHTHAKAQAAGKWYASMDPKHGKFAGVRDAFNLATIGGARALAMDQEIGRIKPGYRADLLIWDKKSPSMLAVAEEDPVAAIILHSQAADISGVIIDGAIRKLNGALKPVEVQKPGQDSAWANYTPPVHGEIVWNRVAEEILSSRAKIIESVQKIDRGASMLQVVDGFHLDKQAMLGPVT